ncbi:hypothetical protein UlMin_022871 [Ulmus minor]
MDKLNDIIKNKSYLESTTTLSAPPADKVVQVKKIQDMLFMQQSFWVKAKVSIKSFNQSFWYMSCDKCNRVSNSSYNEVYECIYCKISQARATRRARAYVELEDSSGSLYATIIGQPAEKFLQCTAKKLMEETSLAQMVNIHDIIQLSTENGFILYLKATKRDSNVDQYKYNVVSILDPTTVINEATNYKEIELETSKKVRKL